MCRCLLVFFFFKQKTADELRISDWSSDVCSSDLVIATYSPDIEFFVLGGERWAPGLEAWRKQNESMFESAPGLHCEVPDRIVQGNYVIAHEHLTSDADDMSLDQIIIYEVRRGKIRRYWSVP